MTLAPCGKAVCYSGRNEYISFKLTGWDANKFAESRVAPNLMTGREFM